MGFMAPTKYITSADGATVTGGAIWLQPDNISQWQFMIEWTSTIAATITIEVSDDPRARQTSRETASAVWVDITAACVVPAPAGTPGTGIARPAGAGDALAWGAFVRLKWTKTGGAGTFNAWFSGQSA